MTGNERVKDRISPYNYRAVTENTLPDDLSHLSQKILKNYRINANRFKCK